MPYAFLQRVPATEEIYAELREKLGADKPAGLIVHVARTVDGGLEYTDVWENEAAWIAFRDGTLEPAVGEVLAGYGIPHTHEAVSSEQINVIDVWQ